MDLSYRVGQIDQRVTAIETTLDRWKHWSLRLAVIFAMWVLAVLGHLNAEQVAKLIVSTLKS